MPTSSPPSTRRRGDAAPVFVRDGDVWTGAGLSACLDPALAPVSDDQGQDVALRVARQPVIYLKRPGGQSRFNVSLDPVSTVMGRAVVRDRAGDRVLTEDFTEPGGFHVLIGLAGAGTGIVMRLRQVLTIPTVAQLETAADGIVFAAFANQGESCVAGSRLLVDETIAEEFTAAVVDRASALRVGMPDDPRADIGALIHHEHRDRVHAAVLAGADAGGKVLTGGNPPGDPELEAGAFYPPTVIASVGRESPVFQKEIFGPVLSVTTFRSEREAVELANATDYGLAQSVWTTNLDRAFAVSRDLEAGTVWVNTATDGSPALAFGGVKASGFGREAGEEGLREFTEYKTVQFRGEPRVSPFARTEPTR